MMAKKNKILLSRKDILNGIGKTKIKASNLNFGEIIILVSLFIVGTSLFNPWFSLEYNQTSYGAFSRVVGIIGYTSISLISINIFIIFSLSLKQKIKVFFNFFIEDSSIFLFSSLTFLILGMNSITTMRGLEIFTSDIKFHSGIILYILGSIIFLFGSMVYRKTDKNPGNIFLTNNSTEDSLRNTQKQKNTIKLPF